MKLHKALKIAAEKPGATVASDSQHCYGQTLESITKWLLVEPLTSKEVRKVIKEWLKTKDWYVVEKIRED